MNEDNCTFFFDGECYDNAPQFIKCALLATGMTVLGWYVAIALIVIQYLFFR